MHALTTDSITSAAQPPELGSRYFLVRAADATLKPVVFPNLKALAARIHRERGRDELQVQAARFRFADENEPRDAVTITAIDAGGRSRLIGHAYLGGRGDDAMRAALEAEVPPRLKWARAH